MVSRVGTNVLCGNFQQASHNIRGRKAAIIGETPWQRRSRIQKAKESGSYVPDKVWVTIISM